MFLGECSLNNPANIFQKIFQIIKTTKIKRTDSRSGHANFLKAISITLEGGGQEFGV
jgi:hypothetical protein